MEISATGDSSVPTEPKTQHSLCERRERIAARRLRGEPAVGLLRTAVPEIAKLFAEEFRAGNCVYRFGLEDIVCDEEKGRFALSADLTRYPIDTPPSGLSLLENGIYAPELTKLIQRDLSPRTDVFSVGAILYSLITGLEPTPELSRMNGDLPPVRIFEPHLPLGLDPILARALSKLPENRYPDPEALADAIDAVLGSFFAPVATVEEIDLFFRPGRGRAESVEVGSLAFSGAPPASEHIGLLGARLLGFGDAGVVRGLRR